MSLGVISTTKAAWEQQPSISPDAQVKKSKKHADPGALLISKLQREVQMLKQQMMGEQQKRFTDERTIGSLQGDLREAREESEQLKEKLMQLRAQTASNTFW